MGQSLAYDSHMLHTRFSELFDLQYPIMSAPMALHSGGALAAAVSAAGGLGTFGGAHPGGAEWIHAEIAKVRSQTSKPFGIGFITPFLALSPVNFNATVEAETPVVMLSFSDPTMWIEQVKARGARVICQAQTMQDVDVAVEAGTDVLVVQGNEAGGHTGHMALLPFLSAVLKRHPDVVTLAAGGIADGPTLAAVLACGADGALLGTAFMATKEAVEVHAKVKDLIVASDGSDTIFTRAWDELGGLPWPETIGERVYHNKFTQAWHGYEAEVAGKRRELQETFAYSSDDPDPRTDHIPMGPAAGLVSSIQSAHELMSGICEDAEEILRHKVGRILL